MTADTVYSRSELSPRDRERFERFLKDIEALAHPEDGEHAIKVEAGVYGMRPMGVDLGGRLQQAAEATARHDLGHEEWRAGRCRHDWTVLLEDGSEWTIYRDLMRPGWYLA